MPKLKIKANGDNEKQSNKYVAQSGTVDYAAELRKAGISCEIYPGSGKLKKQFDYADRKGIPFIIYVICIVMLSHDKIDVYLRHEDS